MPKVKIDPVPEHVVVPDTNILWDKDKKNPVSPDFDAFWMRNLPLIPLSLQVPEVVLGELQFQQATSAIKCASTVTEQMAELSGIAQWKYETKLDHQKIRRQVGAKLEKWLKNLGGIVASTPITTIDWGKVIQEAIWRTPPFTFDPKDKDNEKGFRDALILETLSGICDQNKGLKKNIVFLCNDFLLRTAVESRLKHNKMLLIFESLPDFESYIKLTQEQLTDNFVKSIQTHARSKFYSVDDKTTLFFRENIKRLIREMFESDFSNTIETPTQLGLLGSWSPYNWSIGNEKWWINATRFDELVRPREYHWISRVTVARLLVGTPDIRGVVAFAINTPKEEIQLIGFDVRWKANVKADGRFHDICLIDITKCEALQEQATDEVLDRWRLQRAQNSGTASASGGIN